MSQDRRLAAIMFTDIVGYTALMGDDEESAFQLLKKNRQIQKPIIKKHGGRWLKEIGDGVLASFPTVSEAVYCAKEIQEACNTEPDLKLRIGIHEGEVIFEDDDVFGDGVNIASRLEPLAPVGGIYVSDSVHKNVLNKKGLVTKFIREEKLKNVKESVRIYEVTTEGTESDPVKPLKQNQPSYKKIIAFLSIGIIIVLAFIYIFLFNQEKRTSSIGSVNSEVIDKSIAVLPFNNLSEEKANEHFADGLVEDLLNRISVIEELKVISRTSSDMYRERGVKSVPEIARELGVSHILEGSVQRYGDKARITVQLIDAIKDDHIWVEIYDRDIVDIFETQSEIAMNIASELNTILTSRQKTQIQENKTKNVKAFELYQLGRFYWNKRTGDGYNASIEYFEKAISEDPAYGLAYAGMADTYFLMAIQGWMDTQEGRDKAVELALNALELDENLAEAYAVLGSLYDFVDWDWENAEKALIRALELNPNYSTAHQYYSEHLRITGRIEESREHIDKALELDPLSFVIRIVSAQTYYHRGRFTEALAEIQKCHELHENHKWSLDYEFMIYRHQDEEEKAFKILRKIFTTSSYYNVELAEDIYMASGLNAVLDWLIEIDIKNDENGSLSYQIANLYGLIGEEEKTMEWLEKAYDSQNISTETGYNINFKKLHNNPRYIAIMKKMGLAEINFD